MYQGYWGLTRTPFAGPPSGPLLATSTSHAEALARLDFLRESKSPLGLLLGPRGSGKSAVLAEFARRAERAGASVGNFGVAGAEEQHLLPRLAMELRVSVDADHWQLWQAVLDRFEELTLEGLPVVLLFDDLDRAAPSTLALVERLAALPNSPASIVASMCPDNAQLLPSRLLDQVSLRIDLAPWDEAETREYVQTSLAQAGRVQPTFSALAAKRLFELSGGVVRKVNQLAQLALLAGAGQKLGQVDADTVEAVHEELSVSR